MNNASDHTDANTVAELENDLRDPSYLDDAATYFDDEQTNTNFCIEILERFNKGENWGVTYENALKDIFQSVIQGNGLPDWVEELADKAAKERFGK